jgi:hypothetical protein
LQEESMMIIGQESFLTKVKKNKKIKNFKERRCKKRARGSSDKRAF